MSRYTDNHFELIPFKSGWRTLAPLLWEVGREGSNLLIIVPSEFENDGPSIPFWARPFINPNEPALQKAARLHDYCIADGWTAGSCALVFHDALKADGIAWVKRAVMTLSVFLWREVQ